MKDKEHDGKDEDQMFDNILFCLWALPLSRPVHGYMSQFQLFDNKGMNTKKRKEAKRKRRETKNSPSLPPGDHCLHCAPL